MSVEDYYVRDISVRCPNCGVRQSMKELMSDARFHQSEFIENGQQNVLNPFGTSSRNNPESNSDILSIPYVCRCKKCDRRIDIVLDMSVVGVEVYNKDMALTMIEKTERLKQ